MSRYVQSKPEYLAGGGKRMSGTEPHTEAQPKEEQHGSPGGHLFSQVCSPNVIKSGATHPPSSAALVRRHCGCWGMSQTIRTVVLLRGRWKRRWVRVKKEGAEEGESRWFQKRWAVCDGRRSQSLSTANNCLEKHHLRRVGLFWAHVDYPRLFDSLSERKGSHKKTGGRLTEIQAQSKMG